MRTDPAEAPEQTDPSIVPTAEEMGYARKLMGTGTIQEALAALETARKEHGLLDAGKNTAICQLAAATIENCGKLANPQKQK